MNKIDLTTLTLGDLKDLDTQISMEIKKRRKELYKELFNNVIKAINELTENFPSEPCLDGGTVWEDIQADLTDYYNYFE